MSHSVRDRDLSADSECITGHRQMLLIGLVARTIVLTARENNPLQLIHFAVGTHANKM